MIYLSSPYLMIDGINILRDHADPLQFYYLPAQPQLALNPDGSPAFLFIKYRADLENLPQGSAAGGGFLVFDVDLRVPPETLSSLGRKIRQQLHLTGDPHLAPIEFRAGKTHLIFLDARELPPPGAGSGAGDAGGSASGSAGGAGGGGAAGGSGTSGGAAGSGTGLVNTTGGAAPGTIGFVERTTYAATPSLYGDERTSFSVQLTPEGATLVEDTLDAKTSLIGVAYDLTFVGLRPAYRITLSVDWDRVFNYLENDFHTNFIFAAVDISDATEKLIEQQAIRLDVVSFGAGASDADILADKDQAVQFVKQFITDKFFQPSLTPPDAMPNSDFYKGVQTLQTFTRMGSYTRRSIDRTDRKDLNITLTEESGVEVHIVPQGHLQGLMDVLAQFPRDAYVREVDLADPFFKEVKVEAFGGAAITSDHVDRVQVHFEYGSGADTEPQDLLFSAGGDHSTVQWALIPAAGRDYTYRFQVYFKPDAPPGKDDHLESPTVQSNATKLVVDPRDLYNVQKITVQAATNFPFDRYPQVQIDLRYVDDPLTLNTTFALGQGVAPATWSYRYSDATRTAYQYRLTFFPKDQAPFVVDWQDTINPVVLVNDPRPPNFAITLAPAGDFSKIQRIIVEMVYDDPTNKIHQDDVLTFTDATKVQTWAPRIADSNKRDYSYHLIIQYKDGSAKDWPPVVGTSAFLPVGEIAARHVEVAISATGLSFDDVDLAKIRLRLAYEGAAGDPAAPSEFIFTSLADHFSWSYEIKDPARAAYSYSVTYFGTDGSQRNVPAQQSTATVLAIPVMATSS